ncbi:SEC-C motif-containing protein [Streptomyces sp. SLBN-118]|uniref:YchJ family protein n=1 Tax=Streptomyces sp. SLBN-118 TaxID=2768454 RepID=UPI00114EB148|nr:YchJ family protein [Streptomyces sp. SLBN-118]TQK50830.1 SEC-C motif-containing protein [Streptomyces sp. SLBN-118]
MSRRSSGPRRGSAPALTDTSPCPCGLPATYGECCGRFHSGAANAPTAELLMRSRYSAFVTHNEAYLLRTWHPSTRPRTLEIDPGMQWTRLEILDTEDGSAFHSSGTVTFRARFRHHGMRGALHERSRFVRHGGAWVYVDGEFLD